MKKRHVAAACILAAAVAGTAAFTGCSAGGGLNGGLHSSGMDFSAPEGIGNVTPDVSDNYLYDSVFEQGFQTATEENASYFSLDRNTAGYTLVRSQLNANRKIASDSVRIEEMLNYFTYDYPAPETGEEFRATAYLSDCPWQAGNKLLTVGMRTQEVAVQGNTNNYVFLIDVSGSMSSRVQGTENETSLSLAQYGIEKLVEGLNDGDFVSVVTYASGTKTVLAPTNATEAGKTKIVNAVKGLRAYGSTNASGGLELAYQNAAKNFSQDGNNRVVMVSDGDFNVGITNGTDLKEFVQEKAKSGVYLSVLGVGMGNLRDDFMQTLALNGNGNYAYIDTRAEAEKVLCEELQGMLTVVAKDAKAKAEFDPAAVEKFRLIGYDMKRLTEDDYENSKTDAGEIGSNLCVTALYELELKEGVEENARIATISVRYKTGDTQEDKEISCEALNENSQSEDAAFISCVAEFGLILRASQYKGNAGLQSVTSRLAGMENYLAKDVYKKEFYDLVKLAQKSGYYEK